MTLLACLLWLFLLFAYSLHGSIVSAEEAITFGLLSGLLLAGSAYIWLHKRKLRLGFVNLIFHFTLWAFMWPTDPSVGIVFGSAIAATITFSFLTVR